MTRSMITSGPDVITDGVIETAKNDLEDTLSMCGHSLLAAERVSTHVKYVVRPAAART
jgi:hypothetical protein